MYMSDIKLIIKIINSLKNKKDYKNIEFIFKKNLI